MSSLFHFGRPPQAERTTQPLPQMPASASTQHSLGSSVAAPNPYSRQWQHMPSAEDQHQRAAAAVRRLDMASCRVLVNAASALLTGEDGERYVPTAPDDAQIAAWLAETHVGLLIGEWAGYVRCYRLSLVGRLVVRAFLTDYLLQRTAETRPTPAVHQPVGNGYGYGR